MKIGDKVIHEALGEGEIVESIDLPEMVMVKFINNPAMEYNCGRNPCLVFERNLVKVPGQHEEESE